MRVFLHTVNNSQLEQDWLDFPYRIYKANVNKPLMLVDDVRKVFDIQYNSVLQQGKHMRWIAYDQHNLCAGRIAAFCLAGAEHGQIGFFETNEDEAVAHALFSTAAQWLRANGCSTMTGPVNFGEKDRFWGLMTEGFETKGLYLDNFNPPYYHQFFQSFGFTTVDQIYSFSIDYCKMPATRLDAAAIWSEKKYGYTVSHFQWEQKEKFAEHIHSIYTAAFKEDKRIRHLTKDDVLYLLDKVKPLLQETFCWFAFAGEIPLGFILFLHEPANPLTRKIKPRRIKGFAFATIPSVRSRGIEISLGKALLDQLKKEPCEYEVLISGINNKTARMLSLISKIGGRKIKEHQTFEYKINS